MNKQNHLNLTEPHFQALTASENNKQLNEINSKIEKEYILISNMFKGKYV